MFGYRILGLGGSHPNRGGGRVAINLAISSTTQNYNIFNNRGGTYSAGSSDVTLTVQAIVGATGQTNGAIDTGSQWASGDTVKIMETKPISKSKCWRIVEINERAK